MFNLITPVLYWLLTLLWLVILGLYLSKLRQSKVAGGTIAVLLTLLAIDAFRTLFESIYFGLYINSMYGLLPYSIYDILSKPSLIIIPKLVNIVAGILVLTLLLRRWLPQELREREKWLQHEKQVLDEIIWATDIGTWVWDLEADTIAFNDRWAEIVGYTLEELQPLGIDTWRKLTHPNDLKQAEKLREQHRAKMLDHYEYELRMHHKNGDWIWVLDRGKVVEWSANGKPLRMSGTQTDITRQKLAEEALLKSEARYRQMFETNRSVKLIIDPEDGKIVKANHAACRFYGYDAETLTSLRIADINVLPPEQIQQEMALAKQEKRLFFTFSHKLASGEIREVEVYSGPLQSDDKTLLYSIVHDISERRQVEKALQRSEERYRMLVESTAAVLCEFDLSQGRFTYVSPQTDRMLGYPASAWIDVDSWVAMLHPDDRKSALDFSVAATACGEDHDFEYRILSPAGRIVWVRDFVTVKKENGKPFGTLRVLFDITESKTSEAQIRAALSRNELLISAIEQAAEAIVITDEDAIIQYANPAFEQITGYTRKDALGQNPRFLKSGEQGSAFYRSMWDTITQGHTWNGRFVNKRKDGSFYTEDATISPVHGPTGKIVNFIAVKHDITQELDLEKQLRQAQKLEAIGALASGIAHDFNNILTPILGYTQMMIEQQDRSPHDQEQLSIILNSAQRAKALVEQVLGFARKTEENNQVLQLKPQIEETVALLRASIPATVQIFLELQELQIMAPAARFQQIVLNLCTNAAQAMGSTGGRIRIRTKALDLAENNVELLPSGRYVALSVQDSGPGIEPQILPQIFDPYFTTKEIGEGSGIGLATVQRIVTALGGHIRVESQLGQGSCFHVLLPFIQGEEPRQNKQLTHDLPRGDKHLLLVDDEELLVSISREFLQNLGYRITAFTCSLEALKAFEDHGSQFDLLITDLTMPNLTGTDLARRINQLNPDFPIILTTGQQNLTPDTEIDDFSLLKTLHKPDLFAEMALTLHQYFSDES